METIRKYKALKRDWNFIETFSLMKSEWKEHFGKVPLWRKQQLFRHKYLQMLLLGESLGPKFSPTPNPLPIPPKVRILFEIHLHRARHKQLLKPELTDGQACKQLEKKGKSRSEQRNRSKKRKMDGGKKKGEKNHTGNVTPENINSV